jgi:hypothetical protein
LFTEHWQWHATVPSASEMRDEAIGALRVAQRAIVPRDSESRSHGLTVGVGV